MKYIDAGRLKAEIEKGTPNKVVLLVYRDIILSLIDSLQQEQPDFPTTDEQIKEFLATHPEIKVPEKYKNPDWLFKKQEQSEVDLDKDAVIGYAHKHYHYDKDFDGYGHSNFRPVFTREDLFDFARHFYELGHQAKPEVFDTVAFQKGVQEGRRLEREDAEHLRDVTKKISEDLEEAAEEYASRYDAWNDDQDIAEYAFKAGAEWGAEHLAGVRKMIEPEKKEEE